VVEAPERLARFRWEAQLLAALNHPNIAAIHGLEEHEGRPILVLELVEGEDLSERLKRGPIPLDEALAIARQVAEALEEAHGKGIVHRDLKPGNIKLREDGTVKVLDYGLAKVFTSDQGDVSYELSQSPTLSRQATASGVLLGTAAYMSPEQAKGKSVDKRCDIWAFGCVLFEMLAGRKAFSGKTISETLAEILKGEPEWVHLPGTVSPALRHLLERCLTKEPKLPLRDIGDAWPAVKEEPRALPVVREMKRGLRPLLAVFALGALLSGLVAVILLRPDATGPGPTRRFTLRLDETPESNAGLALSPDGGHLIYVARIDGVRRLLIRDLSGNSDRVLEGTNGAGYPFFSPDGEWIGFLALAATQAGATRSGTLKKINLAGEAPVTLQENVQWAVWPTEDAIVFQSDSEEVYRIPSVGGIPEPIEISLASGGDGPWSLTDVSRDEEAVLAVSLSGRAVVHSTRGGDFRTTVDGGAVISRFVPTGHIVYSGAGKLAALRFDAESLETVGTGVPLAEGIRDVNWAFSTEGTLAYGVVPKTRLVRFGSSRTHRPFLESVRWSGSRRAALDESVLSMALFVVVGRRPARDGRGQPRYGKRYRDPLDGWCARTYTDDPGPVRSDQSPGLARR
jgi:serine/threonine-protein kinase